MEFFALLNSAPAALIAIYLIIEVCKAVYRYKTEAKKLDLEKTQNKIIERNEITESIFQLYDLAKDDLEKEKIEIRALTKGLRRANVEIAILERKVAALMRVIDAALSVPEVAKVYMEAMEQFNREAETIKEKIKDE